MITVRYGGKRGSLLKLVESPAHLVVRTARRGSLGNGRSFGGTALKKASRDVLSGFDTLVEYVEAGVQVLRVREGSRPRATRDHARQVLRRDEAVEFAGRVLVEPRSRRHFIYTENFFVKFNAEQSAAACRRALAKAKLSIKRELSYAKNAYFVSAEAGTGLKVFDLAEKLLADPNVELCHPELIRERRVRAVFEQQWHLKKTKINGAVVDQHANVEAAWELTQGSGVVIAVIDDGVDIDHEEFASSAKITAPFDATRNTDNPRPRGHHDDHGTACAGVACADGNFGASGVAPRARLMPIRLASQLGSQSEADAFVWAADHGADVISCSWGPSDGDFEDPEDPLHKHKEPLPDSTRLAIDYAVTQGRNGLGCVVLFAAGNGNESVDNDGYASYERVIAVAACDDRGKKAPYSDFGKAVFCSFPSNHYYDSSTPGIWTTDRAGGIGYNWGSTELGDVNGRYTNSFGGTSSACPGAAGVAALVIARNPELRWERVRDTLKRACDRIDVQGGKYGADGRSAWYGYGRLNARRAVELALPTQASPLVTYSAVRDVVIRDFKKATLSLDVAAGTRITSIAISIDIDHTWIGDLVVALRPPASLGLGSIPLHNREGRESKNLRARYDALSKPSLAACLGRSAKGRWTLEVTDNAARDEGVLRRFALELGSSV
jgi:subtilisin family serine protease